MAPMGSRTPQLTAFRTPWIFIVFRAGAGAAPENKSECYYSYRRGKANEWFGWPPPTGETESETEQSTHIALPGGAVDSGGGGGRPEQVQLGLGGEVVCPHGVRRGDAAAGDGGADLPHLVQHAPTVAGGAEAEPPEDPDAAVGAELGGEVGSRERDGPGLPERVPGYVVRPDGPRRASAPVGGEGPRDERLRARHAVARRVERPRHPPAGRGGRRDERDGEVPRRAVVGPVHGRAQAGQVVARRVRAVRRERLPCAPPAARRRVRRQRGQQRQDTCCEDGAGAGAGDGHGAYLRWWVERV